MTVAKCYSANEWAYKKKELSFLQEIKWKCKEKQDRMLPITF
jgi:hypothetical protein